MEHEEDIEQTIHTHQHSWLPHVMCKTLDYSFRNSLHQGSPQIPQPSKIKVHLRPHQKAVVHAMLEREKASTSGISYKNTTTYTNYGVLGDEVGTGKSLIVLAYIAHLQTVPELIQTRNVLLPNSRENFFTTYTQSYTRNKGPSLIVVPHTLYRQWQDYCKLQTTLQVFYAKSHKELSGFQSTVDCSGQTVLLETKLASLQTSDVVLVSNTLYKDLEAIASQYKINWTRVFIDEVDSIHIPGTTRRLNTPFAWFISATWANFIMNGKHLRPALLEHYDTSPGQYTAELGEWLRSELGIQQYRGYMYGRTVYFRVRSSNWLANFQSDHGFRTMVLLQCSKQFLEESRSMPRIVETTILCEQSASHRAIEGLVNANVQAMLHAGNIEGALQELGVREDTPMNLVEAATHVREKELDRLKKTLLFKESIEYASPQQKEQSLANLRTKIQSVETQLQSFRERLTNVTVEECPICYDDPNETAATLTPCCHRMFCATCILSSLSRRMVCPMCRAALKPEQLTQVVKEKKREKKKAESKLLSKPRQLIKFLQDHPEARVLVFSRYEDPFLHLERECEAEGITYHTLRGNKDTIAATIRSFESGEKRVLFLPTQTAGAGLNLVCATHIVTLHAMTPEEEKQVIGRAYRLGRTSELQVVRLRHEGETIEQS